MTRALFICFLICLPLALEAQPLDHRVLFGAKLRPHLVGARLQPKPQQSDTGKQPQQQSSRVHLLDVAKRLSHGQNSYDLAKLSKQFEQQVFTPRPGSAKPSTFERSLKRLWNPESFYQAGRDHQPTSSGDPAVDRIGHLAINQFWQPSLFPDALKAARRALLPRRFPWSKTAQPWSKQSPLQDLIFDKQDYFKGSLINTLARFADKSGWISAARLNKLFGDSPSERALLKMITRPHEGLPKIVTWNHLLEYLDAKALDKTLAPELGRLVPKMPGLKWITQKFNPAGDLARFRVFGHQHILGNTLGFLQEAGITPDQTSLWGKVYSQDPRVAFKMQRQGYRVNGVFSRRDRRALERELKRTLSKISDPAAFKKPIFMLLDDGGEVIETVANYVRKNFPRHAKLFTGVEQTTRGITRLKKIKLPFPVVAVGSSWGKTKYGSPMIGYALFTEAHNAFQSHADIMLKPKQKAGRPYQATVVGYGNIGHWVARYLKEAGYDVMVYDKDPAKRREAQAAGFTTRSRKAQALNHAQLLVSCVGKPHMRERSFQHLPDDAMVVNGASLDELPRTGVAAGGLPKFSEARYDKALNKDIVQIFKFKGPDGRVQKKFVALPRYGGVMNFPLSVTHPRAGGLIPGRYIQFDLGLLYLGLLQASEGGRAGLRTLRLEPQRQYRDQVEAQLGARGESLMRPSNWFLGGSSAIR